MSGIQIFWVVVLCLWVLILILSVFVTPLRIFWQVLKYGLAIVVELVYLVCVWWWVSFIRICFHKMPLKVSLFSKAS